MNYLTTGEAAEKWGISRRRVTSYCNDNRILGVIQKGAMWLIPADVEKPIDLRRVRKIERKKHI